MSAEELREKALDELWKFRTHALELRGRIRELPPDPDRSATAGGDGMQRITNDTLPPGTDSRAILETALRDVLSAIDTYLQSEARSAEH